MSSDEHRVSRNVYVAVLSKDEKSPLAPESDEENKPKDEKKAGSGQGQSRRPSQRKGNRQEVKRQIASDADKSDPADDDKDKDDKDKKKDEPVIVKIDIDGIGQRILSLPIPAKNYLNMLSGKSGILFLAEGPMVVTEDDYPNISQTIQKFDLSKRKVDKLMDEVNDFAVSFDGEKILYRKGDSWATASADDGPGGAGRPSPASARSNSTDGKSTSSPAPCGSRFTTRLGASSATSSTTRTITASTSTRPRKNTRRISMASPPATNSPIYFRNVSAR